MDRRPSLQRPPKLNVSIHLPNPERVRADYAVLARSQWRGPPEHLRECDLCGERGSESGEVDDDSIDAGARGCEGDEG